MLIIPVPLVLVLAVLSCNLVTIALVMEHLAKFDFWLVLVLFEPPLDGTAVVAATFFKMLRHGGLVSRIVEDRLLDPFLAWLDDIAVVKPARAECRRDKASFGLSVPTGTATFLVERAAGIEVCVFNLLFVVVWLLLLLLCVRLLRWMAVVLAPCLAIDDRKNPGAGIVRVGVDPARLCRS